MPDLRLPAAVASRQLGSGPELAVASVMSPLKGTVPVSALRGVEWVLNPKGCGYRAALKRILEEAGIPFRVVVEPPDFEVQLQLIREGVGVGIIPRRILPPRWRDLGLRIFQIEGVTFSLMVWLSYRNGGPIILQALPVIEETVSALLRRRKDDEGGLPGAPSRRRAPGPGERGHRR